LLWWRSARCFELDGTPDTHGDGRSCLPAPVGVAHERNLFPFIGIAFEKWSLNRF